MKQFANPVIELSNFAMEDVVTTSTTLGENESPTIPGGLQSTNPTSPAGDAFA